MTRRARAHAALFAMLLGLGCGASDLASDDAAIQANRCAVNEDCGSSGFCYAGGCYAHKGDGYPIVLEIVPDPSSGPSGGTSFLLPVIPGIETNRPELALSLPKLSDVNGHLELLSDSAASCPGEVNAPISVHVTLTRTEGLLGLPKAKHALDAEHVTGDASDIGSFALGPASIAEGTYDLYVEATGCSVAPLLSSSMKVEGESVHLSLSLPPATILRGAVKPPTGASLEGWHVDLVEPLRGRVISTAAVLGADAHDTSFELAYRPVQRMAAESSDSSVTLTVAGPAEGAGSPLLRIRPPRGVIAPTALWDLAAADLSDSGHVQLDLSGMSTSPVHLTGHVEGSSSEHPLVTGAIVFSSLSLAGAEGGLTASYTVTVPTDERGAYAASLLPGQYRVVTIPDPALPWAITEAIWQVSDSSEHQAGRTLVVDAKPSLLGRARIAAFDVPLAGAAINAVASTPVNPNSVLDAALGKTPALPRAASQATNAEGMATLDLDPGLYDLWIRPPESSWLPWLVQPRTLIPSPTPTVRPIAFDFHVPWPVLLGGRAYDADGVTLANALVRAYALLGPSGADAPNPSTTGAVQIGETHTAPDGRYKLLLPSKLTP